MKTIKLTMLMFALCLALTVSTQAQQKASNTNATITNVTDVTGGINNAVITSEKVPTDMDLTLSYSVSVTAKNTGTSIWRTDEYKLKLTALSADNQNNAWIIRHVDLPNNIAPGAEVTFVFDVTPWIGDGVYNFQAQLMQNEIPFGQISAAVPIEVH